MEYRQLGGSGLKVPVLTLGTGTFGGKGEFFKSWGSSDVEEAKRLVDVCLDAGVNMFDSADVYSGGAAEEILGKAIAGRRDKVLISTKATFTVGESANDVGSSRYHLINAVEKALKRLGTDYIDLFQLHAFDAIAPQEETMSTLNDLVRAGKIRYIGCSNFSGWHLMKSLAVSDKYGWPRHVAHQAYYSLGWPRLRMGIDAFGARSKSRHNRVESAGLGALDRQNSAQSTASRNQSFAITSRARCRAASGR